MHRGQKVDIFGKARVNVRLSDVWRARFNYHDGHFDFFFFSRPMYKYNIFLPKIDLDICWSGNVAGISAHADSRLGPVSGGSSQGGVASALLIGRCPRPMGNRRCR